MRGLPILLALLVPSLGRAQAVPPALQIRDSRIVPRDVADDVARIFNSAATRRVTGAFNVDSGTEIDSDLAIIGGTLTVSGRVTGHVVAINANVLLRPAGRIERDVTVLGGSFDSGDSSSTGLAGDLRVYAEPVEVQYAGDRIIVQDGSQDELWYRQRDRWQSRIWSDVRLVSARTYNRVEGLPVLLGPIFGREWSWGRLTVEALGILRSVGGFEWTPANVGHSLKTEIRIGRRGGSGVRVGGRLFDVVDAVEQWHLSDMEAGLASFLLHRDYRDYFDRHGRSVDAAFYVGERLDLTISYSDQEWGARETRDPFTLFRDAQNWRPNPRLDAGRFHIMNLTARHDTRNDERDPWSGWLVVTDYEYGAGTISSYGPTSPFVRDQNAGGRTAYDRAFVDVRRYNRLSPEAQLNLRFVLGGWLSGDELPLQRRFSLGGPGDIAGNDFRRLEPGTTDFWTCSGDAGRVDEPLAPAGIPAQCERVALAQMEFRGTIRVDPFGFFDEERGRRRHGWGRAAEWVVFADAGRGWLVGERSGELQYGKGTLPPLQTFRADVGIGVRLDDLGLYLAKSVTESGAPINFFVRLKPRF